MKTRLIMLSLLLAAGMTAMAGELEVNWHEPGTYVDVKGANESDKRFRERTFRQLEAFLQKQASELPDGVKLSLKVTDLNLAGHVRYNFAMHRDIRVVTDTYWPMIAFDYKITADNQLVDAGSVELKDMSFLHRGSVLNIKYKVLGYEKRLLSRWFKKDVTKVVNNWQQHQKAVMAE